ncbi:MAG TPA: glycoside hydrolase domain-containing protein [Byssovorax sp.]|jgi:hypothetical protein
MNLRRLAVCLAPLTLLAATGCAGSGGVDSEATNLENEDLGGRQGVDYSWARPSPADLHADGYTFAARYVSGGGSGKDISAGEAQGLIGAGLDVVLVWEQEADAVLGGYGRGVSDAQAAASEAASSGQPGDRPIYFAVDFDAQASQQPTVDAYFDGVASVIGRGRTGAYGGYYLISRLFDDGRITWGWQAYAWSYGNWDPRAQVRQTQNGILNDQCDLDVAMTDDFGQWGNAVPVGPPTAAPPAPSGCGAIEPGQGLVAGQSFSSCDGRFALAMQTDGNLVVYHGGQALWSTGSNGTDGYAAIMQGDGNFVLYGAHSNPIWASGTNGSSGARLVMQDDGNLVVYGPGNNALWASGTNVPAGPPAPSGCGIIHGGDGLSSGASFGSCGGAYSLAMQTDGNLVYYHNGVGALWATGTDHTTGYNAIMQGDGNFVLYDIHGAALWDSHTEGNPGAFLAAQDDGNLVVYTADGAPLWDTGTNGR